MKNSSRIKDVLDLLDPPNGFHPWHGGPSLMECLKSVSADQAAWKPTPERNSIWSLALHIAYWKYSIIRQLNPEFPEEFERSPANFPTVPASATEKEWKEDINLLQNIHHILVDEIKTFPPERLDEICPGKKDWTYAQLIVGIAAHDTYHIGQIQVLKKMFDEMNQL